MTIILLLIPISLIFLSVALVGLTWAIKSGQYDDLDSPSHMILYDDDEDLIPPEAKTKKQVEKAKQEDTHE